MAADARDFYDDLASDYDAVFEDWDASVRRQGALLETMLGEASDPILDVAAGMGTQAIGLALRGHSVVARDLSPRLIERGRQEAARLSARLEFDVGDMRKLHPGDTGRFGTVLAFDNAFAHLDETGLAQALAGARGALRHDGKLLVSIRDYDALTIERPTFDAPRMLGTSPHRRLIVQLWTWADDCRSYQMDHIILREDGATWRATGRQTRCNVVLRSALSAAAHEAGLREGRWSMPDETGFYQPSFSAVR